MGVRNKRLLNEAMVFGQKYYDPKDTKLSHGSYVDRFLLKKRKLKARKLKKLLKRYHIDTYQELVVMERKFPIGSLFCPCSHGFWNSRLKEIEFLRLGGFLYPSEFTGTDGRGHGFGGCGDCDPLSASEVSKIRDEQMQFFVTGKCSYWWDGTEMFTDPQTGKLGWHKIWGPEDSEFRNRMIEYYSKLVIHEDGTATETIPYPR